MASWGKRALRVVLVEDEPLFLDLLRVALSHAASLSVVGTFTGGEAAVRDAPGLWPHVAILDVELGSGLNGIQVGLMLRRVMPEIGIVLLTNHWAPRFMASLPPEQMAGWCYLLKKSAANVETLVRAVEGAASRMVMLAPHLVAGRRPRSGGVLDTLTPRQHEILSLIAQGLTNAAIAERLALSIKGVEKQINQLYQALGLDQERSAIHPRGRAVLLYLNESQSSVGPRELDTS